MLSSPGSKIQCALLVLGLMLAPAWPAAPLQAQGALSVSGGTGGRGGDALPFPFASGNGANGNAGQVTLGAAVNPGGSTVYGPGASQGLGGSAALVLGQTGQGGSGDASSANQYGGNGNGGGWGGGNPSIFPSSGGSGGGGPGYGGGGGGGSGIGSFSAGGGGGGGSAAYQQSADAVYSAITIAGGRGGDVGLSSDPGGTGGGSGGGGGNAFFQARGTVTVSGQINVQGGDLGFNRWFTSGSIGGEPVNFTDAGGGGLASFIAAGDVSAAGLTVAGGATSVWQIPGMAKYAGGAVFQVDGALTAPSLTLRKNNGAFSFSVGSLRVASDTSLSLVNTSAAEVNIKGLALSGGSRLTVSRDVAATSMAFGGDLAVSGAGNSLVSPIAFEASGRSLNFDLAGTSAGSTLLSSDTAVNVAGATVNLANTSAGLELGGRVTLIDRTVGTVATGTVTGTSGGTSYDYHLGGSGSLSAFLSRIRAEGDYSLTGPRTYAAGAGAGEGVGLMVGGRLRVDGGLSLASGAQNPASLSAAVLAADRLSLNNSAGGGLSVQVDYLDVLERDLSLELMATTAGSGGVGLGTIGLGARRTLTVTGGGAMALSALEVNGVGATYAGDLDVERLRFDFRLPADLAPGQILLNVTGQVDLRGTSLELSAKNPLTLLTGYDDFYLIEAGGGLIDGGFNDTFESDAYGNRWHIRTGADTLTATLFEARTFRDIVAERVGRTNANIDSGTAYLDWLSRSGAIDPERAMDIGQAFDGVAAIGGQAGYRSIQQFIGGYGAYANQALSLDGDRFRRILGDRNRAFSDAPWSPAGLRAPGAGDGDDRGRMWLQAFGTWAEQDDRDGLPGYEYDSGGAALGYEYQGDNFQLGLAAAYSGGDLKVGQLRYKNEADVLSLGLYGAWRHDSGFYVSGALGYGRAWNDYRARSIRVAGGVKSGKYDSDSFRADLELGRLFRLPGQVNLIPSLGLEYSYLKNEGWTEKINDPNLMANRFQSGHDSGLDIPLGLRLNQVIELGGTCLVPELRAAYVYAADQARPQISVGYAGAPGGARMLGVDPGRSRWRLGAGLSGQVGERLDLKLDYDFEGRSGFKSHQVAGTIGFSF